MIGQLVKGRRAELKMSQAELAQLANISRPTVVELEKGRTTIQMENFLAVMKALKIKIQFVKVDASSGTSQA